MGERYSRRELLRLGVTVAAAVGTGAALSSCAVGDDARRPAPAVSGAGPSGRASGSGGSGGGSSGGRVLADVDELALTDTQAADVAARDLVFGFLINNIADDFSRTLAASGREHAEALGIELRVDSGDFDAARQLSQFTALVRQGVDGIFLTAVDAATIGAGVLRANEARIPVFVVGGPPSRGEVVSVMNAASYQGSKDAGAALMRRIGRSNAEIAVLGIPFALQTIRDREKGILDAVGEASGQVVSLQSSFDQDELLDKATSAIADPNLGGLFATWSLAVDAVIEAVARSGRDIPFAGYDAEVTGYRELAAGNRNLVALSGQQAFLQGRAAVDGLCQAVLGNRLAEQIITPNLLVTAENYEQAFATQYPGVTPPF